MSDAKDQHEPSMEEILASIRRIISEDGEPPADGAPGAAAPGAAAAAGVDAAAAAEQAAAQARASAGASAAAADDDVLVLTEEVEEPGQAPAAAPPFESSRETEPLEAMPEPSSADFDEPPPPPPPPAPRARDFDADGRLISETTAAASVAALSELVAKSHREPDIDSVPLGQANKTLEDITRELLRPFLKSWLDDNLPQIVERIVREEIGRLAIDAQRR